MMKNQSLGLYFKEFIKTDSTVKPDYVCDLFIYEPTNVEEAQLGSLFMLGEIESIPKNRYRNFDLLLNLLISAIKREFYSNHKRNTSEALEASLNKANLYLADFTEKGNVEWIGNLHFICGAFSQNILHITQVGEPIIKLFRGTTISHIENKFPLPKKIHPLKTFGNIASGTMVEGDKVILATKNILNIAPPKNLKELAKGSCCQIINNLKKITENQADKTPLLCLVLETKKEAPEEITTCIPAFSLPQEQILPQKSESAASKIYKPLVLLYRRQQNKPAFFIASLLMLLILILPFAVIQKINYHVRMNDFNRLSAQIQEVQKRTDVALIYSDKEKARGLIQQDQLLLASLSEYLKKPPLKNSSKFISAVSQLQEKHQEQQDSIDNVKRIKNLEEILDFSQSGFIVNPIGVGKTKDILYFYELESGILYSLNLSEEKKNLTLIFISAKDELRKMTVLENDQIGLFGQSGKMYLYDSNTNEYKTYSLDPNVAIENIKDIKNYLSNLYLLDTNQSNIIKYAGDKENIFRGSAWLSAPEEELKNAQSMAVDGSIYILNVNGTITEYFRGEKSKTIKPSLDNPLAGNNKIFIKKDFKNFYVSDPANKRVIILDKNGAIINQYINDEFAALQDFLVTDDEKEIYFLCGKKVYKFGL
jgi:hypothetical protein